MSAHTDGDVAASWEAAAKLYHAFFTGIVLATTVKHGELVSSELVYRVFARQRQQRFLPGLRKLGIDGLPHAVAAAQYHYLSNNIGGVSVEYMYESDRKAWIRYTAPRWIWEGTALCGIPSSVSIAMLRGWHAQNGVSLGNPRLGFVCTKQAVDGQSGLEGYYFEYEHPLVAEERLRFSRAEDAPDFNPANAPRLGSDLWPDGRIQKAKRNYALEYVRTTLPVAVDLLGPNEAIRTIGGAAYKIGFQYYHEIAPLLRVKPDRSVAGFAAFMKALATAQGDRAEAAAVQDGYSVCQRGWTLYPDLSNVHPAVFECWNQLFVGALDAHNHRLRLRCTQRPQVGGDDLRWIVG